mgnify:CR=1 FL=1
MTGMHGDADEWIAPCSEFGLKALSLKEGQMLVGLMGFQRYGSDEDTSWLVLEREPNHVVGSHPDLIEAELTYALGQKHWGLGYAIRDGQDFDRLRLHRAWYTPDLQLCWGRQRPVRQTYAATRLPT